MTAAIAGFLLTAGFVTWVTVGYPLTLALRARRERRVRTAVIAPTVSAIVPVRNGESFLAAKLDSLLAQDYPPDRLLEILVVSDGSTDQTETIARGYASRGVRLLVQSPRGKCAALNLAIPEARGELLLLTDVRQQLEPSCLARLAVCFADPDVGAASGELRIRPSAHGTAAPVGWYWHFETWVRSRLSRIDSMLGATGPIYAMRRALAVPIPEQCLLDDMYLPLAGFRDGFRLVHVPEAVAWDYPTNLDAEFTRKVRTLAGNWQLLGYNPWLLGPANRMWFDYWSLKLGRMLLPFALLALLATAAALPTPWRVVFLALQGGGYGLAVLDVFLPRGPIKAVTGAARAFVVMMGAALIAPFALLVEPRRLWKTTRVTQSGPSSAT